MRKSNIALLVAVLVSSPFAFANGGHHGGPSPDIDIEDVGNRDLDVDVDKSFNKDLTIDDSFKSDDDALIMWDMNNVDIVKALIYIFINVDIIHVPHDKDIDKAGEQNTAEGRHK